ncbi:hypothetical protein D3C71_1039940 [compost metagenome]
MAQNIGAEQLRRRAAFAALLHQRGRECQGLANVALFQRLLRLRELTVKRGVIGLLLAFAGGVTALTGGTSQILCRRLIISAALGDIPHPGERVGILRVGLQHLLKLALCRVGIPTVQGGVAFAFRRTANIFTVIGLNFAVLRMALQPGIVELFVARFWA